MSRVMEGDDDDFRTLGWRWGCRLVMSRIMEGDGDGFRTLG